MTEVFKLLEQGKQNNRRLSVYLNSRRSGQTNWIDRRAEQNRQLLGRHTLSDLSVSMDTLERTLSTGLLQG